MSSLSSPNTGPATISSAARPLTDSQSPAVIGAEGSKPNRPDQRAGRVE